MSDFGRKGFTEQAGDKLKPESQKSNTDKLSDTATGVYDRAASSIQPDSQKSTTQKAGDTLHGGSDDASDQGKGVAGSVSETLGNATQSAKDTLSNLAGNNK